MAKVSNFVTTVLDLNFAWGVEDALSYFTQVETAGLGYERRSFRAGPRRVLYATGYARGPEKAQYLRDFFVARLGRCQGFYVSDLQSEANPDMKVRFGMEEMVFTRSGHEDWETPITLVELPATETVGGTTPGQGYLPVAGPPGTPDHLEETFPADVSRGASVGWKFETEIYTTAGGRESRTAWRLEPEVRVKIKTVACRESASTVHALYQSAGARWKSFYAGVEHLVAPAIKMRFADDQLLLTRVLGEAFEIDANLVSVPYGNTVA